MTTTPEAKQRSLSGGPAVSGASKHNNAKDHDGDAGDDQMNKSNDKATTSTMSPPPSPTWHNLLKRNNSGVKLSPASPQRLSPAPRSTRRHRHQLFEGRLISSRKSAESKKPKSSNHNHHYSCLDQGRFVISVLVVIIIMTILEWMTSGVVSFVAPSRGVNESTLLTMTPRNKKSQTSKITMKTIETKQGSLDKQIRGQPDKSKGKEKTPAPLPKESNSQSKTKPAKKDTTPSSTQQSIASEITAQEESNLTQTYQVQPPPPQTNVSRHFVERWCDLTARRQTRTSGYNATLPTRNSLEWYPTQPDTIWQQRTPAVMIPGAMHSGVYAISRYLSYHPQIAPPPNNAASGGNQFFSDRTSRHFVSYQTQATSVYRARQRLYHNRHHFASKKWMQEHPNHIALDATGTYLLHSSVMPRRLFCVAPWVKLVIVIQDDPIDRMVHQYLAAKKRGLRLTFRQWVDKDMAIIQQAGLLSTSTTELGRQNETGSGTASASASRQRTDVAWYDYTQRSAEGPLGRSIYEIQLRQWFQAILAMGKRPSDVVLLLKAQDFCRQPAAYYKRILQFVGVNDTFAISPASFWNETLPKTDLVVPKMDPTTAPIVTPEHRKELEAFFRPYQEQLPEMLRHFGMDYAQPA